MPRQSRGRQRIPIQLIENQDDMYATFSKRRLGLYKKASYLSTLFGIDIGVIVFSPTRKPHSFFSPSIKSVIERYQTPNIQRSDHARFMDTITRTRTNNLSQRLDELRVQNEGEVERANILRDKDKAREKGWWEDIPVDGMSNEQVQELKRWFGFVHSQTTVHKERLQLVELGLSSPMFSENVPNMSASNPGAPPYEFGFHMANPNVFGGTGSGHAGPSYQNRQNKF